MKRYQNFQCKHYAPLWDDLYFSFFFFFFAHKNAWLCSGTCFIPSKSAATFPLMARQVERVKGKDVEEMCKLNQIQRRYRTRLFLCSFAWMETLPAELTARSEPRWLLLWRHVMRHHSMSRAKVQPAKKQNKKKNPFISSGKFSASVFRKYTNAFTHGDARESHRWWQY